MKIGDKVVIKKVGRCSKRREFVGNEAEVVGFGGDEILIRELSSCVQFFISKGYIRRIPNKPYSLKA